MASNRGSGPPPLATRAAARPACLVALAVALLAGCSGEPVDSGVSGLKSVFTSTGAAEAVAWITVDCDACAWDKTGSEGIVFAVTVDDRAPLHLPIVRGGKAEYRLMLGAVSSGEHAITIAQDPQLTAASLRGKTVRQLDVEIEQLAATDSSFQALSLAPFVHARPDTVGKFNDVPLLMWYEIEPTERGKRYRYSVIFSNEDGGTPADRLMATWGRTTDIEYVYSVEVDAAGAILSEDMQGPKHEILPFTGKREGRHPLLWVSTENNMVLDHGTTTVRYAPAPALVDLTNVSREQVMDANPWTYEVMAKELAREGKIVAGAPTGQGTIPDLRRYVFLEGCGEAGHNAITVSVNVNDQWLSSDRGVAEYRIVRDGCFRAAIPLPGTADASDVRVVSVQAFPRKDKPTNTPSRFTRLNTVFSLNEKLAPGPPIVRWDGQAVLRPGGPPFEIPVP